MHWDYAASHRAGSRLAAPGGVLTVVVYPGHAGGDEEARAVSGWMSALPSNEHEVRHLRPANRPGKSPECWAVRKRRDGR